MRCQKRLEKRGGAVLKLSLGFLCLPLRFGTLYSNLVARLPRVFGRILNRMHPQFRTARQCSASSRCWFVIVPPASARHVLSDGFVQELNYLVSRLTLAGRPISAQISRDTLSKGLNLLGVNGLDKSLNNPYFPPAFRKNELKAAYLR